ncbi:hypothetical protein [Actinomycetospora chibensis]|uniref:Uncharacterized protein n=1 Tax=Actinomycetospora chibensis TaxID=663606 RepID=A0ABV9RFG2_9PSEU|nr:hypothetical protein [Actinomycetospora chibensis]MDD7924232.1 hypothetical protein [Actinomycetospora chibensis]
MSADEDLMADIVNEAQFDWIDLGHAMAVVKIVEGGDDRVERYRRATDLVVRLVREGRLVPGDIGTAPGAFAAWDMAPGDAAQALERHTQAVLAGDEPLEPWQPCMFAAAP